MVNYFCARKLLCVILMCHVYTKMNLDLDIFLNYFVSKHSGYTGPHNNSFKPKNENYHSTTLLYLTLQIHISKNKKFIIYTKSKDELISDPHK